MDTLAEILKRSDLTIADIDLFAAVVGPGSFTGLRVGLATVKGLALARNRPVVGVSSLQTLAAQVPFCSLPVWSLIDARKNEVYAASFNCQTGKPEPVTAEAVIAPQRLLSTISGNAVFIGSGAVAHQTLINDSMGPRALFPPPSLHAPRATAAALLAWEKHLAGQSIPGHRLCPTYIRPSEAELAWKSKNAAG